MYGITPSSRLRRSPYFDATVAEGVRSFSAYNRMLMPTGYGDPEAEYWRLINGVSQWDVSVQRQVEITGPDAAALTQALAPRDLSSCRVGQGKYVPLCDHDGTLINDPVLLKLAEDRFWLSIADSDVWLWARAVASERGLRVNVSEPDVSPMALQGPKAEDVVASIFGDWIRDLRFFWFKETSVAGIPLMLQRSGWSKQGGFELYLMDGTRGAELWNIVREAGAPWGIGPGNPNWTERTESGLLSFGGDTDKETNPFEVRLGKYVDLDISDDVVGIEALRRIAAEGPKRHQLGVVFDDDIDPGAPYAWPRVYHDGRDVGGLTHLAWSWRMRKSIGFALISVAAKPGDRVSIALDGGEATATLCELPFL